jgi:hypothetical protein
VAQSHGLLNIESIEADAHMPHEVTDLLSR